MAILVCTGYASDDQVRARIAAGDHPVLARPFDARQAARACAAAIQTALPSQRTMAQQACTDEATEATATHDEGDAAGSNDSILFVDDWADMRLLGQAFAENLGRNIRVAASGTEALDVLANDKSIGVAVVDVNMPGLSGSALRSAMRDAAPHLRIVFMSGHDSHTILTKLGGEAPDALLTKPFDLDDFANAVRGPYR